MLKDEYWKFFLVSQLLKNLYYSLIQWWPQSLKDNLRPIENALYKVNQISGYEFDWNKHSHEIQQEKGHDVGLVAQEVEKVLPEVIQIRSDGIKAVAYDKVVSLLVQGIKELSQKIDKQDKEIKRLKHSVRKNGIK